MISGPYQSGTMLWFSTMSFVTLTVLFVANLARRLLTRHKLPSTLPWAGTKGDHGLVERVKANLMSFFHLRDLLDEGYHKYSKNDHTYVLPYFLNGPEVMLPPSQIPWLTSQPESVLCQDKVNRQFLQAEFVFAHATRLKDPVHPEVIQQQLTRKLASFVPDVVQEMEQCLADNWGLEEGIWREVSMYDTLLDIITRLSLRVLVGEELCRDPALIKATQSFNRKVALPAAAITLFPEFMRPLVAPIFVAYDYLHYLRCRRIILPILKARLEALRQGKLPMSDARKPSNDYMQWAIEHALAKPDPNPLELDESVITSRFAVLCFAAIQSSVITLTNVIFDIVSSPERDSIMAQLREDALQASGPPASSDDNIPVWNKASIARMRLVDSAIRESMRLNGFIHRGILKMVVAKEGVTLPDGSHIPRGVKVGVSGYSIHRDEDNYEDPNEYKPFRFVQTGSEGVAEAAAASAVSNSVQGKTARGPQALVNTSESFMGFSHGEGACPGRFFAANQLKIALSHIAMHYDLEPVSGDTDADQGCKSRVKRPENKWFFGHVAPPLTEKVRVRRRPAL